MEGRSPQEFDTEQEALALTAKLARQIGFNQPVTVKVEQPDGSWVRVDV